MRRHRRKHARKDRSRTPDAQHTRVAREKQAHHAKPERRQPAHPRRWIAAGLSGIAGIASVIGAMLTLLPRIAVEPLHVMDPTAPFSTEFVVKNTGYIPLRDVRCDCVLLRINGGKMRDAIGDHTIMSWTPVYPFLARWLSLNEETSVNCNVFKAIPGESRTNLDMAIGVTYRAPLLPWDHTSLFRFVTARDIKDEVRWLPRTMTPELMKDVPPKLGRYVGDGLPYRYPPRE